MVDEENGKEFVNPRVGSTFESFLEEESLLGLGNPPKKLEGPRHSYSVKIPPNATPEEIKVFMKEFMKNWGKDKGTT